MKKIIDWIRTHKVALIAIFVALVLLLAQSIFVQYMFKTEAQTPFWEYSSDASDFLTYLAGFEAFVGSVFLGMVALKQTQEANRTARSANNISNKMLSNELNRDLFERQPSMMLSSAQILNMTDVNLAALQSEIYDLVSSPSNNHVAKESLIILTLINASPVFAEVKLIKFDCYLDIKNPLLYYEKSKNYPRIGVSHVAPGNKANLYFTLQFQDSHFLQGLNCWLELRLINSIGEKYNEVIQFSVFGSYNNVIITELNSYDISPLKRNSKRFK